jgi:class 3 adenylate cyclase
VRRDLPSGTVTFLFTDVEGSTKLLHDLGPEDYAVALAEHRRILREAFGAQGGIEVDRKAMPSSSASRLHRVLSRRARQQERLGEPGPIFERGRQEGRAMALDKVLSLALGSRD